MAQTLLIVEPRTLFRDLLGVLLEREGYRVLAAGDAGEAFGRLREAGGAEMVVLDVDLPGMTGLELLARLRQAEVTARMPALILTDIRDKNTVIRAAALGVRDYVLKGDYSAPRLLAKVKQLLEAPTTPAAAPLAALAGEEKPAGRGDGQRAKPLPAMAKTTASAANAAPPLQTWPHLLTREQTLSRLDQVSSGKTIAGVVAQVIAVASSPSADLSDVARVISSDPLLASRVVMLANSASTGSRARVSTIDDAARVVGIRGIQNMAISIGIFGAFPPDEIDGFNTMRCWQHSFAVAEFMGLIARQRKPEQEGFNHLVGLCHDLGEILLRQHFMKEHETIAAFAMQQVLPLHQVESTALGIRHPEIISRLMGRMGLPPNVVDLVREFYERQTKENAAGLSPAAQLLGMANMVAHGMMLAASTQERVRPFTKAEWRVIDAERAPPQLDVAAKRGEIIMATNLLARLPAREEARLIAPLIEKRPAKILYVRPELYIELDPLAYALELACELRVVSALPAPQELACYDGLVMAGVRVGAGVLDVDAVGRAYTAAGKPAMPVLVVVAQEQNVPLAVNWMVKLNGLRLADIEQWVASLGGAKLSAAA